MRPEIFNIRTYCIIGCNVVKILNNTEDTAGVLNFSENVPNTTTFEHYRVLPMLFDRWAFYNVINAFGTSNSI